MTYKLKTMELRLNDLIYFVEKFFYFEFELVIINMKKKDEG